MEFFSADPPESACTVQRWAGGIRVRSTRDSPRFDARFIAHHDEADPNVVYTAALEAWCSEAWCSEATDGIVRNPRHAQGLFGEFSTRAGDDILLHVLCPAKQ